jgi:hypothetical protein
MTKFTSFLRQLNIYGFTRIFSGKSSVVNCGLKVAAVSCQTNVGFVTLFSTNSGPDKGSYYHDGFLRGQPVAVELIKRMPVKGKGPRRASSKSITRNFYAMVVNHPVYSETCTTPRAMSASHATAGRWSFSRHTVEMQTTCNEALPAHLVASPQSAIVTRAASTTHSASGNGGRSYNEPEYSSMDLLAYYFGFRFLVQHWLQARAMGEDEVTPETAAEVLCQQETKLTSCEVAHKHNVMSAQDHESK